MKVYMKIILCVSVFHLCFACIHNSNADVSKIDTPLENIYQVFFRRFFKVIDDGGSYMIDGIYNF
jgi:hypothetical protein